jgi:2-keto-4-pentenoate hydratase/2-oxohepta-3-ene-1,7-dioic acid hydratase in catechol pathway
LAFASGTPINNLYEVIEAGEDNVKAGGEAFAVTDNVSVLPPISGRDIIAIGKNYGDHVKETASDASKAELPKCPIVFTKRATSIIANEEDILLHEGWTEQLDYEGEIGVIIGKGGFQISEADAPNHVWGYTIINDVSAREQQIAHVQAYMGKPFLQKL